MNILITGAAGFVGKNLVAALQNIKDNKDRTHPDLRIDELYLYDLDTDPALLSDYCKNADFVFHLAGVNRPEDPAEFMK
ncbi:MAG: NAD-dependent epimerase/dehydratase family protein, partial [Clostridia bacterium]|nr:NAD-dependent epimerase/dehydratase family protein [Clostridia bacterium]